jgi:hypothetical protein
MFGREALVGLRARRIDRSALLDRLGEVDFPSPDTGSLFDRASLAARLPALAGLDQQAAYDLCCRVIAHLREREHPSDR